MGQRELSDVEQLFEGVCPTDQSPVTCVYLKATSEQLEELAGYADEARQAGGQVNTLHGPVNGDTVLISFRCRHDHYYSAVRNRYGDWNA
jgi:hypothetical protein